MIDWEGILKIVHNFFNRSENDSLLAGNIGEKIVKELKSFRFVLENPRCSERNEERSFIAIIVKI